MPVILSGQIVDRLFQEQKASEGYSLDINLETQLVTTPSGEQFSFEVDDFRKHCLLNGLDDIGITLQDETAIHSFEQQRMKEKGWLFADLKD